LRKKEWKMDGPVIELPLNNRDVSLIEAIKLINEGAVNVIITNNDKTYAVLFKPGTLKVNLSIDGIAVLEPQYKEKDE